MDPIQFNSVGNSNTTHKELKNSNQIKFILFYKKFLKRIPVFIIGANNTPMRQLLPLSLKSSIFLKVLLVSPFIKGTDKLLTR